MRKTNQEIPVVGSEPAAAMRASTPTSPTRFVSGIYRKNCRAPTVTITVMQLGQTAYPPECGISP